MVPVAMEQSGKNGRGAIRVLFALLTLPVAVAYGVMFWLATDIPHIDDYGTILGFSLHYESLPTFSGRLGYIFASQYLEYKFVLMHLAVAAELGLTHHLNFEWLGHAGNLLFLPMLYLLWRTYFSEASDPAKRLLLFLPMAYLLLGLNYGEGLDWPSATLDYLPSIFFSMLALHLISRVGVGGGWRVLLGACLSALLAYFSAGNSFLIGPLGLMVLLSRRSYGAAAWWIAAGLAGIAPYFYHFSMAAARPHGTPTHTILFFLGFAGAAVALYHVTFVVGLAIVAIYFWALRTGYYRKNASAVLGATWLLGSAALAAIGRGNAALKYSYASRYQIFSDLLLIFCYGYLAELVQNSSMSGRRRRQAYAATAVCTFLFWVGGDLYGAHTLLKRRTLLRNGLSQYAADPTRNSPLVFGNPEADVEYTKERMAARAYMNEAIRTGLYHPPVVVVDGR